MTLRQRHNLKISAGIIVVFILIIYSHQRLYLPEHQSSAISHYNKWLDNIDESLSDEVNFIIKSKDYKKDEKDGYNIHGIEVILKHDQIKQNNSFIQNKSMRFSLNQVMNKVYTDLDEDNHVALLSNRQIIWSSWKLNPATSMALIRLTDSTYNYEQKALPEKVVIDGQEYYVFAVYNQLTNEKAVQLFGLIDVKTFNHQASTLPIRRVSYVFTILLICLLMVPILKILIIKPEEEVKAKDYKNVLASLVLLSFLFGAIWGLFSFREKDRQLFKDRLEQSTLEIGDYYQAQLSYILNLLEVSQTKIKVNPFGYFTNNSCLTNNLDITSVYLMDKSGKEIGVWTKRDEINFGKYDHRNYFKAFSDKKIKLYNLEESVIPNYQDQPPTIRFGTVKLDRDNALKSTAYKDYNSIQTEILPPLSEGFYLQTIASLTDGTIKNVMSLPSSATEKGVLACSFKMEKLSKIIHPPGYKFVVFDKYGNVFFHSKISEVTGNNIFYNLIETDDLIWNLSHKKEFFGTYKISGFKSYCYVKQLEGFSDFYVMTYYSSNLRSVVQGQAWIKLLFIFTILVIACYFIIYQIKSFWIHFRYWLIAPVVLIITGALVTMYFYQYESKQLEAWTLDESQQKTEDCSEPYYVFNYFEEHSDGEEIKKLPYIWNYLAFPFSVTEEAKNYRRVSKAENYVDSHKNHIRIGNKTVEVAQIINPKRIFPFIIITILLIIFACWLRSFFVLSRLRTRSMKVNYVSAEEFAEVWSQLSNKEKYLMHDLMDDGIANLKNKEAVEKLYTRGIIKADEKNRQVVVNPALKAKVVQQLAIEKEKWISEKRFGTWKKMELPLYISVFGVMVLVSVFKDDWLNSVIGIISLLATGLGAINKLFIEFKPEDKEVK